MPFTKFGLDTLVAQDISTLSQCNAPDLSRYLAEANDWIPHFILNSTFRVPIDAKYKPFFFGIIRRVLMALIEYQNGRTILLLFLSGNKEDISLYFYALSYFEISVTLLYQAYEFLGKLVKAYTGVETKLFNKKDGSPLERLNRIYNISKHLESSTIAEGHLHHVWISNDGICTKENIISFTELADIMEEYINIANSLSNLQLWENAASDPA